MLCFCIKVESSNKDGVVSSSVCFSLQFTSGFYKLFHSNKEHDELYNVHPGGNFMLCVVFMYTRLPIMMAAADQSSLSLTTDYLKLLGYICCTALWTN